jgi:hypothetical protein
LETSLLLLLSTKINLGRIGVLTRVRKGTGDATLGKVIGLNEALDMAINL